jgi:hypothetical protein
MDEEKLRSIEQLNALPFNQKARTMLEEKGEAGDPASLYSVRLALWAIREGLVEADAALGETLEAMTSWSPERLGAFFMHPGRAAVYELPGWEGAKGAEELAVLIINQVEARILVHFPWYYDLS